MPHYGFGGYEQLATRYIPTSCMAYCSCIKFYLQLSYYIH